MQEVVRNKSSRNTKTKKENKSLNKKSPKKNLINLMYMPAVVLFTIFVIYPFLDGVRISLTNWNGYSQEYSYIGFSNYKSLFKDENVIIALKNTFLYGVGSTIIQQIIGLSYAVFLNSKFRGRGFARTVIYLPIMVASVIMGYIWYFLLQYNGGAINDILIALGMQPIDFIANGKLMVWIIVLINSLQFCGVSMVIYLAGLQNISEMYYEAARLDGATKLQQFKNITLPLLKPSIVTSVTLNLIGGLKLFDAIKALTNGGPGYTTHSLSTLINYTYFNSQSAGYAAAIGITLFIIILVTTLVLNKVLDRKDVA
ncbi:MAG TPA: sugar ABC transporter permease [Romboutsia timonensis]|uniref:Sugar ABC transporter permease n=1 Tax=Romboutsia timonensis TaxID=1776391 RepID=A0A921N0W3_9FIRM|nr:sugar ABC transporter permease [Romboutsia timonensis]